MTLSLFKALRARPRLMVAVGIGIAAYLAVWAFWPMHPSTRALIGWNCGAIAYLLLAWRTMVQADVQGVQRNARQQDEGRVAILVLVVLAQAAVLVAVTSQILTLKQVHGSRLVASLALAAVTVATSWLFTQVLFAVHYAHDFYLARHAGKTDPLDFPGTTDPVYSDFFHFACVIGTSGQTADINFYGSGLRPVGTAHCILAYAFNTTLLALCMNLAAGQFG